MRVRLTLAYDGRQYLGWQLQPRQRTVQAELNRALSEVFGQPIFVTGAGRTDRGVHALGQVAHFDVERPRVPIDRLCLALGRHLPPDLMVYEALKERDDFHASYDALSRLYRYRFVIDRLWPHEKGIFTPWPARLEPDPRLIFEALSPLFGENDFTSYTLVDQSAKTRVRRLRPIEVQLGGRYLDLSLEADGFLRKMIRMIIGQLWDSLAAPEPAKKTRDVLEARDNALCAAPAPPDGLYLERVNFQAGNDIPS